MASQAKSRNVNCYACAKRKVRCDRADPCSHCRRRKETCTYPNTLVSLRYGLESQAKNLDDVQLQGRLRKLENFVRRMGVDPDKIQDSSLQGVIQQQVHLDLHRAAADQGSKIGHRCQPTGDMNSKAPTSNALPPKRLTSGALVEVNKETTYIEAPMWFSWSDATKSEKSRDRHESIQNFSGQHDYGVMGQWSTLLNPVHVTGKTSLQGIHPSPNQIEFLWIKFLSNVHPLIKIFFAWEKELIVRKAVEDPQSLSSVENTLMFALYFITALSLSNDECSSIMMEPKPTLLNRLQPAVECRLLDIEFISTGSITVLQAFLLYLLAMQNRARSSALFALMGIASRIAERMGIHRDGKLLKLPILRAEERRRVWWQMQYMEIALGRLLGYVSMTPSADWNSEPPSNLEDEDFQADMEALPPERRGLTSMSHCLWRYFILQCKRLELEQDGSRQVMNWVIANELTESEKMSRADWLQNAMREKFLKFCEPLNPLHVQIQIGIQSFFLALQRTLCQPTLTNAKISEMSWESRQDYLKICTRALEYYILGETTESIKQFSWYNENNFQLPAFGYVVIEAYHQAKLPAATELWSLIDRCCLIHPSLTTETNRPEFVSIARLILGAWDQREDYLQQLHRDKPHELPSVTRPESVNRIIANLGMRQRKDHDEEGRQGTFQSESVDTGIVGSLSGDELFADLDLDLIDWDAWPTDGLLGEASLFDSDVT